MKGKSWWRWILREVVQKEGEEELEEEEVELKGLEEEKEEEEDGLLQRKVAVA